MNVAPTAKSTRDRESPLSAYNTNDKSVSRPTALPVTKKRTMQGLKTNLFGAATPRPASQPSRGQKLHTDPFDGERQSGAPRHLVKYIDVHYNAPRQTGLKHVRPALRADRGFVSAGGAISFGGRRHQLQPPSLSIEPSPEPHVEPPQPKATAPTRRSPISHEVDLPQPTEVEARLSGSRPRSHAPTLVGVLSKEEPKKAKPFTLKAPFHMSTPPPSPLAVHQQQSKPWDKDQTKGRVSSSLSRSKAPFHTNTPRDLARDRMSNVRPPWHTDTPR